jgi:hypothetical protein
LLSLNVLNQESTMSDLVTQLANGRHPIEVSLRPNRTVAALKECLDRGYVHVKFTGTRGGTELGVPVDRERSRLNEADLDAGSGSLTIVGRLSLDFVPVTCVATIDVATLTGAGHLELTEPS